MDASLFFQHISRHVTLSAEEQAHITSLLHFKTVKKKQFFIHEGEVARGTCFVTTGLLRSYSIDGNGVEHVIQFAPPGWWVGDLGSIVHRRPSILNVDALEDSVVIFLAETDIEDIYDRIPAFDRFTRIITQNALAAHQARLVSILSSPAKERYAEFCRLYPSLIDCLSQKQIASYIGVTPEFLSKMLNTRA